MKTKEERNQEICAAFLNEQMTATQLSERFQLSRTRVNHILRANGLDRDAKEPSAQRSSYTGVLLDPLVKEALRTLALEHDKTLSTYVSDLIAADLKEKGLYPETPHISNEIDLPLPFESSGE
jgi:hypothetical protein